MADKGTVEAVFQRSNDAANPVLLNFQNGHLTSTSDANYVSLINVKGKADVAAVITETHLYHGAVGEGYPTDLTDGYLAVRNRITNKIRFIPIDQATMTNYLYHENDERISGKPTLTEVDYKAAVQNFGGKKALRSLDRSERMKVNVDVVKDQLQETVDNVDLSTTAVETAEEPDTAKIRPQFNEAAEKIEDVYDIYDVVSAELLKRLDEEAKAVLAADISDLPIESDFLLEKIQAIQKSPTKHSQLNLLRVKLIIYMDALINLVKSRVKYLSKAELSQITEKVENHIRAEYSQPGSANRIRTTYTKEKGICYFIVLALLSSDNFQVDINDLVKALSLPRAKIIQYATFVNAKPKAKTDILWLRLPKHVKQLSNGSFKRKRK